jgi:hypothetical protein
MVAQAVRRPGDLVAPVGALQRIGGGRLDAAWDYVLPPFTPAR